MTTKVKENLIALGIAILLTGGVMLALNSSTNLATNVLGVKKDNVSVSDLKLAYENKSIVLKSNKNIDNVASLSLELVYDKDKLSINKDSLDSSYNLSFTANDVGNSYTVIIQNIGKISKGDSLLTIKNVDKNAIGYINAGHVQVITNNGKVLNLTVSK